MRRDEMAKPSPPTNQLSQADACRVEPISPPLPRGVGGVAAHACELTRLLTARHPHLTTLPVDL